MFLLTNLVCFFLVTVLSLIEADVGEGVGMHNNWAVLVDGSRYWFNYRHVSNVLAIYHVIKKMGIPDNQIILMMGDDAACNARNVFKASVFADTQDARGLESIYDDEIQVDYRGMEVNVESVLRVLTDRHFANTPASKRLASDENSYILVYMTGHGGDTFLKFHDKEEIQSADLADAFKMMESQGRYKEILFIADTCQAETLYRDFTAKNIIGVGSSALDESSYSHVTDRQLGVSVIDRFTHFILRFFDENEKSIEAGEASILDLLKTLTWDKLKAHAKWDARSLENRPFRDVKIVDFFSAITDVQFIRKRVNATSTSASGSASLPTKKENENENENECLLKPISFEIEKKKPVRHHYQVIYEYLQSNPSVVIPVGVVLIAFCILIDKFLFS